MLRWGSVADDNGHSHQCGRKWSWAHQQFLGRCPRCDKTQTWQSSGQHREQLQECASRNLAWEAEEWPDVSTQQPVRYRGCMAAIPGTDWNGFFKAARDRPRSPVCGMPADQSNMVWQVRGLYLGAVQAVSTMYKLPVYMSPELCAVRHVRLYDSVSWLRWWARRHSYRSPLTLCLRRNFAHRTTDYRQSQISSATTAASNILSKLNT